MSLYCPRCGVLLAEDSVGCPLCGAVPVRDRPAAADAGGVAYPPPRRIVKNGASQESRDSALRSSPEDDRDESHPDVLTSAERRRVAVELLSVAFGIALGVAVLADLFANRAFSWSLYAAVGLVSAWLYIAMPLILYRHPWILFAAIAPASVLMVFLLDVFDGRITWFFRYGLPLVLSFAGIAAGTGAVVGAFKRRGLNAPAAVLCGVAAFCLCVETTVDLNSTHSLSYDWSVVVAFALVPTAGLLFYLHYRIMNRASLRKLFRL